jgi:hypothetical protein
VGEALQPVGGPNGNDGAASPSGCRESVDCGSFRDFPNTTLGPGVAAFRMRIVRRLLTARRRRQRSGVRHQVQSWTKARIGDVRKALSERRGLGRGFLLGRRLRSGRFRGWDGGALWRGHARALRSGFGFGLSLNGGGSFLRGRRRRLGLSRGRLRCLGRLRRRDGRRRQRRGAGSRLGGLCRLRLRRLRRRGGLRFRRRGGSLRNRLRRRPRNDRGLVRRRLSRVGFGGRRRRGRARDDSRCRRWFGGRRNFRRVGSAVYFGRCGRYRRHGRHGRHGWYGRHRGRRRRHGRHHGCRR